MPSLRCLCAGARVLTPSAGALPVHATVSGLALSARGCSRGLTGSTTTRAPLRASAVVSQKKAAGGKGAPAAAGPAFEEKLDLAKCAPVNLLKGASGRQVTCSSYSGAAVV